MDECTKNNGTDSSLVQALEKMASGELLGMEYLVGSINRRYLSH